MKQRLKDIFDADKSTHDYKTAIKYEFGLSAEKHYDILVVSDNSASGESLVLRTQEQKDIYNATRFDAIPKILVEIAKR